MRMILLVIISLAGIALITASCTNTHVSGHEMQVNNGGITAVPLAKAVDYDAVYVVNGGDNTISVIDTRGDSVTGVIRLSGTTYPHHAYLSPDRSTISISMPGIDFSAGHYGIMALWRDDGYDGCRSGA